MAARRSALELYRDALLILAMEGRPMKRTRFMYGLGMSWSPFLKLLEDLIEKKLVKKIDPTEYRRNMTGKGKGRIRWKKVDGRTKFLVEVTMKGQYVLRWLDGLLKYIADTSDPHVRPPLWILQTLFRHRIEDIQIEGDLNPFTAMQRPLDVGMPGLQFRLPPINTENPGAVSEYRVINNTFNELLAIFEVKGRKRGERRRYRTFCPECGVEISGLRGLKIHIGRMHEDKKKELWAKVEQYLKTVPTYTL